MFLEKTVERNRALVECAFDLHQRGEILPDTYLIDADAVRGNARAIKEAADANGIKLYFMLKQLGRNPCLGRMLMELGYEGAVAVDYREALALAREGVKLGHIGHLVQTPKSALKELLSAGVDIVTVYSLEKAAQVSAAAAELGIAQNIMVRVSEAGDLLYPGQEAGVSLEALPAFAEEVRKLGHVALTGVCAFPCLLYNEKAGAIAPTPNAKTVAAAAGLLRERGFAIEQVNMPSATCAASMETIKALGGTHGEPGHGLSGTTPYHAVYDAPEIPAMVYVSEISHRYGEVSYCYGGGHYRRGHVQSALAGRDFAGARRLAVTRPDSDSIDYHFGLSGSCGISDTVVMAFRTQIFVTRSLVAIAEGIGEGRPRLAGIYDSLGNKVK